MILRDLIIRYCFGAPVATSLGCGRGPKGGSESSRLPARASHTNWSIPFFHRLLSCLENKHATEQRNKKTSTFERGRTNEAREFY